MNTNRGLWVAVFVIAGVIVATIGGILAWIGGIPVALAILAGAGGFVAFVGLSLTVAGFLMRSQP
ncbi:hypothetical protein [Nonomuraea sp. 10N515B]|uniref:hypothetical protein n=1 Tax=Nonomuraea sp. 10N515B TaxID=3457422 RepID=UPI003FCD5CE5